MLVCFNRINKWHVAMRVLLGATSLSAIVSVANATQAQGIAVPARLQVRQALPAPPRDVAELRFRDIYKNPVGPLGLELTEAVRALDGKRVRVVGFMVAEESATPGVFMFAPMPATIGHDDEALADDLPPSTLFVHLESAPTLMVPHLPGLLQLSGILSVGAQAESQSARVSNVRLLLDKRTTRILQKLDRTRAKHLAAR